MHAICLLLTGLTEQFAPSRVWPEWAEWFLVILVWGAVLLPYLRTAREWMAGQRVLVAGKVRRRVLCPDLGRRARLEVLYSEPAWGRLKAIDVTRCSLFGPAPVTCEKKCLLHL